MKKRPARELGSCFSTSCKSANRGFQFILIAALHFNPRAQDHCLTIVADLSSKIESTSALAFARSFLFKRSSASR